MKKAILGAVFFLLAVILLSAVLSPPVFWIVDSWMPRVFPFRRVFNRMVMISALVSLWPLARYWGVASWKQLGLADPAWKKEWLRGLALGCATMAVLFSLHLIGGARAWLNNLGGQKIAAFLATALVVGFLEELLFRGLFFHALREKLGKWAGLWAVLLSAFFADAHFLKAQNVALPIHWQSGWEAWGGILPTLSQTVEILPHWFSLFLVGLILCAAVWRQRSLWLAIGLHTGWILILKCGESLTIPSPLLPNFWFGETVTTGAWAIFLLFGLLAVFLAPSRHQQPTR
ncbi:MAG: CPBP family intramembrane glutamic endopeptidase [bacterium]